VEDKIIELEMELPYFYIPFNKRYMLFEKYLKQDYGLEHDEF